MMPSTAHTLSVFSVLATIVFAGCNVAISPRPDGVAWKEIKNSRGNFRIECPDSNLNESKVPVDGERYARGEAAELEMCFADDAVLTAHSNVWNVDPDESLNAARAAKVMKLSITNGQINYEAGSKITQSDVDGIESTTVIKQPVSAGRENIATELDDEASGSQGTSYLRTTRTFYFDRRIYGVGVEYKDTAEGRIAKERFLNSFEVLR